MDLWKTVYKFLKKLKIEVSYDSEIPLLGIQPEEMKTSYTTSRKIERDPGAHLSHPRNPDLAFYWVASSWSPTSGQVPKSPRVPWGSAEPWEKQWSFISSKRAAHQPSAFSIRGIL